MGIRTDVDPWPLVGRAAEVASGRRLIAQGTSVVIMGDPGVGKTRLATELAASAISAKRPLHRVRASEASSGIPLGAFAHLVPDVDIGDAQPLRRAVAALNRLSSSGRLLLLVDDAHLLDPASAVLVQTAVAEDLATAVVTVRAGVAVPDPITALWKDLGAATMSLRALVRNDVETLVRDVLRGDVDGATVERIWNASQGNALFVRELVRSGLEEGALAAEGRLWSWSGALRPGERLAELLKRRLVQLKPTEMRAMETLAIGEPVPRACLSHLGLTKVVERLARLEMVATGDDADRNVRLIHPLFGDVVRANIPAIRVDAVRRRLVDAFEAAMVTDDDRARFRVALWRVQVAGEADAGELRWAARQALRTWDGATAELLARAAERADPGFESTYLVAEALRALKRGEDAATAYAAADAMEGPDALRAQNAYGWANTLTYLLGRPDDARRAAQQALAKLTDPLARQQVLGGLLAEGLATVEELAVEMHDEQLSPATSFGLGLDALLRARTVDAMHRVDAALGTEAAWVGEYPTLSVPIRLLRIWALAVAGRPDEATAVAIALYDESVRMGTDYPRGTWCLARGMIAVLRGSMNEAATVLREGATALAVLDPNLLRPMFAYLAMALAATPGGAEEAEKALAAARSAADGVDRVFGPEVVRAESWLHAARGDLRAARDAASEAASRHRESAAFALEAMARHDVARFGAPQDAVERLEELAAASDGELLPLLAEHARSATRDDGQALLAVAIRFRDAGMSLFGAEAAVRAADAAARRDVRVVRAAALELAERAAASVQPVITPALQRRVGSTLTGREREVADLAARGLSSPQIADQLAVSTRTVDNLLGRVYTKLQLRGRSDLRAALAPTDGTGRRIT